MFLRLILWIYVSSMMMCRSSHTEINTRKVTVLAVNVTMWWERNSLYTYQDFLAFLKIYNMSPYDCRSSTFGPLFLKTAATVSLPRLKESSSSGWHISNSDLTMMSNAFWHLFCIEKSLVSLGSSAVTDGGFQLDNHLVTLLWSFIL